MRKLTTVFKHYESVPTAAKASFWFFFCNVLQKGILFLTVPIITRMLSTMDYGHYSIFISYAEIIIIFGTLSLYNNGYNVGMKRYFYDKDCYTASIAGLMILLTSLCFFMGLAVRGWISTITGLSQSACLMVIVWMYGQGATLLWYQKNRYEFKYRMIVVSTVFTAVTIPLLKIGLILFFRRMGKDEAVAAILGQVLPVAMVGLMAWIAIFSKSRRLYVREYWRFALQFNIPLIPYYLSQTILNQADRIMIERMVSAGAAGIYSVAYSAAMAISVINQAVNNSFIPWQFQQMQHGEHNRVVKTVHLLIIVIATMHMLVIFVAPEFMKVFAAADYVEAIYVVPPVTVGVLLIWLTQIFINVEFYYEKNRLISLSSVFSALLNVVLNAIAIPQYGYLAAAYTTLICYFANMIFHGTVAMRLSRQMKEPPVFDLKKVVMLTVVCIMCMFVVMLLYDLIWIRYGLLLAICVSGYIKRRKLESIISNLWMSIGGRHPILQSMAHSSEN